MDTALLTAITTLGAALVGAGGLVAVAVIQRSGKGVEETLRERLALSESRVADCEDENADLKQIILELRAEVRVLKEQAEARWRTTRSEP